jgi:hypothetical protein
MHYKHIRDLAWDLVEATRPRLDARLDTPRLNTLFVTLGVGDYESAIDTVLVECSGARIPVAPELAQRLGRWVELFGERDESGRRQEMLKSMLGLQGSNGS